MMSLFSFECLGIGSTECALILLFRESCGCGGSSGPHVQGGGCAKN